MKNKLFGIIAGKHRYYTNLVCFIMLFVISAVHATSLAAVTPQIEGGHAHTISLKSDGMVWAWGSNLYGQLGDGSNTDRTTPVRVAGLSSVTAIAGGANHTIALKSDGTVWTWGENNYGQLGDGTTSDK